MWQRIGKRMVYVKHVWKTVTIQHYFTVILCTIVLDPRFFSLIFESCHVKKKKRARSLRREENKTCHLKNWFGGGGGVDVFSAHITPKRNKFGPEGNKFQGTKLWYFWWIAKLVTTFFKSDYSNIVRSMILIISTNLVPRGRQLLLYKRPTIVIDWCRKEVPGTVYEPCCLLFLLLAVLSAHHHYCRTAVLVFVNHHWAHYTPCSERHPRQAPWRTGANSFNYYYYYYY